MDKPETLTRDEAVRQWRDFLKANVNGPDAQIDAGISAALCAMREARSSEQVAIAALAACSRWVATAEDGNAIDPSVARWYAWARQQFGGPPERVEAAVLAALEASKRTGASDAEVAEAGARAATRWQDKSTPSASEEPSKSDLAATSSEASAPSRKKADVKQIALLTLSTLALTYMFLVARSYSVMIIQVAALYLFVYVWLKRSRGAFIATFCAALICDVFFAVGLRVRPEHVLTFLLSSGGALAWAWRRKPAAPLSPQPDATTSPGNSHQPPARVFGNADRGFVAGLMYMDTPIPIYRGRQPLYHTAQTATFAVRRAGIGSNGRPLPSISVRWLGWKIEGALAEGDEIGFAEPPVEHRANSPSVLYNLTQGCTIRMLPVGDNPGVKRAKTRYWLIRAFAVLVFLAIAATATVFVHH